jgi:formiminotetrahydrofolate cyclodeaminase
MNKERDYMSLPENIAEYLSVAASKEPTPGGGSVSALSGALGISMAVMAANFSMGRKKFLDIEEEVQGIIAELSPCQTTLHQLMLADAEAYKTVSDAYGLPKSTAEEKTKRSEAIQGALKVALEPPRQAVQTVATAVRFIKQLAPIANAQLISDVGVAAHLLKGALEGLLLNVQINTSAMKNKEDASCIDREMKELADKAREDIEIALVAVTEKMNG